MLGGDAGVVLPQLARSEIGRALRLPVEPIDTSAKWLTEPGASFVTLTLHGNLRGCIGSLVAYRGLAEDVRGNARAAAFEDPRFYPLSAGEFDQIAVEVSVLSSPVPMEFSSKQEALANLRPGVDGVVLSDGRRRATFLPQVWDELPSPEVFIAHLMVKAGLPSDHWSDTVRMEIYTVTAFHEGTQ